jgi:hypothetical protein
MGIGICVSHPNNEGRVRRRRNLWLRACPTFRVPAREYRLLAGPIDAVAESVVDSPWSQSPNLWWPHDHAWCVATEIDLNTTYIGCTEAC